MLDKPEQIQAWVYISQVSKVMLEIKGLPCRVSVFKQLMQAGWIPQMRMTHRNKILVLATLVEGQPRGPVIDRAHALVLSECKKLDLVVNGYTGPRVAEA